MFKLTFHYDIKCLIKININFLTEHIAQRNTIKRHKIDSLYLMPLITLAVHHPCFP